MKFKLRMITLYLLVLQLILGQVAPAAFKGPDDVYAGQHIKKGTKLKLAAFPYKCLTSNSGWTPVRHVPASFGKWHPAKDGLKGTEVYGDKKDNTIPWSIDFSNEMFN